MLPIKDYLHNETRRQFFGKSALDWVQPPVNFDGPVNFPINRRRIKQEYFEIASQPTKS